MDENSLSRACRPAVKRPDCNSASWMICFVRGRDEEGREGELVEPREADLLSLARQGSANSTSKLAAPFLFHSSSTFHQHVNASMIFPAMDTLEDSSWDVVISGTGLPQSLLALYVPLAATLHGSG